MNIVILVGNLTKDPDKGNGRCSFNVAIDRVSGEEKKTDFPRVTVFGKLADICGTYLKKGSKVVVEGRIQTGSYQKNGDTIFTTDIIGNRVKFLNKVEEGSTKTKEEPTPNFVNVDGDIPF